jgi:hydroxymethylpyrimidine/phosphomethylpyrimidine kinase
MMGSVEAIAAIAEVIADYPDIPVVLDPVLASGRGDQFADEEMIEAMIGLLLPQTTLLTPNSLEARRLAQEIGEGGEAAQREPGLAECAHRLINAGCEYVLVTGTHEGTPQVINTLYGSHGTVRTDRWDRLSGSYHGSGCTLASAIAAYIACGENLAEAVMAAQEYTWHTLAAGFRPGMGQFSPDRLFWSREEDDEADEP